MGWGGVSLVARATGLSRPTITAGLRELDQPSPQRVAEAARVRRLGGGRPPLKETDPGLLTALESLLEPASAATLSLRSAGLARVPGVWPKN